MTMATDDFNDIIIFIFICRLGLMFKMFNATFNNISIILWRSVLLVEENGVPGENHRSVVSHWQTLSHNVVLSTARLSEVRTHNISFGYGCSMPLSTIFQLHPGHQFNKWRIPKIPGENHGQPSIKYASLTVAIRFTILVMIGTDCIGRCEFNCHTITAMSLSTTIRWQPWHSLSYIQIIYYKLHDNSLTIYCQFSN
jgi:hypothetical protein